MGPVMMVWATHEQQPREMIGEKKNEERIQRKRDGSQRVLPHPQAHAIQSPVICVIN